MFYDGFVKLCNERNTTPTAVMKALNLSTGSPAAWKQGRTPTTNTMQKIADYFGVTKAGFDSPHPLRDKNLCNAQFTVIAGVSFCLIYCICIKNKDAMHQKDKYF